MGMSMKNAVRFQFFGQKKGVLITPYSENIRDKWMFVVMPIMPPEWYKIQEGEDEKYAARYM